MIRPHEHAFFALGHALHIDQLVYHLGKRLDVELVLPPQHAQRQPAVPFQVSAYFANDFEQVHHDASASCVATRAA